MNGMILLILIVAGLALLDAAAMRFGADSRIGQGDTYGTTQTTGLS